MRDNYCDGCKSLILKDSQLPISSVMSTQSSQLVTNQVGRKKALRNHYPQAGVGGVSEAPVHRSIVPSLYPLENMVDRFEMMLLAEPEMESEFEKYHCLKRVTAKKRKGRK
jgi:hypothetical protein